MSTAATANLVGITGIARRLVMDGALDEAVARQAMAAATAERKPLTNYLLDNRLVAHGRMPFSGPRKIVVAMGSSARP